MIDIRPVTDLRDNFPEIENTVQSGNPVYLTENGYGTMVVLSIENYSKLTDRILATEAEEQMMDISDALAEQSDVRLSGEEVFGDLRAKLNKMKAEKTVTV